MAGRDNVLFSAAVASGTSAGTVVPLSLLYGIENVRQGYGQPKLKFARAFYYGLYSGADTGVYVEIKNSNWIDSAGLLAQAYNQQTALNRDSVAFMRGRDKALQPNTSFTINATLPANTTAAGTIYVLFEISYEGVEGINTEDAAGSPVYKTCKNASVTAAVNTVTPIGSFDNLLQDVTYVMSEVGVVAPSGQTGPFFVIIEGFSNQKGLIRIFPCKSTGLADQIEGSVRLTKQTYNIQIITGTALTAAEVAVGFEMIASKN